MSCDACKWPRSCAADGCWRKVTEQAGIEPLYETWSRGTSKAYRDYRRAKGHTMVEPIEHHPPSSAHSYRPAPGYKRMGHGPNS